MQTCLFQATFKTLPYPDLTSSNGKFWIAASRVLAKNGALGFVQRDLGGWMATIPP